MFTGLIEEAGTVVLASATDGGKRLCIRAERVMDDLAIDHSIAVNGVCLTVVERTHDTFTVDVVAETLRKTTTGFLSAGSAVNLERAVRMSDRLGGHLVQGHVDITGTIEEISTGEFGWEMWIAFPRQYRKWLIPVGSICIDGVSLTIADLQDDRCKVAIIPHTLSVTTLSELEPGASVNLEFDLLAKYIENITTYRTS
ncbi:MAG: riboflavin synthase [Candidatus Kapabacteria bacterium]|nr:riboflavin synthase [Candidatus Kapabacteria bacterium]